MRSKQCVICDAPLPRAKMYCSAKCQRIGQRINKRPSSRICGMQRASRRLRKGDAA